MQRETVKEMGYNLAAMEGSVLGQITSSDGRNGLGVVGGSPLMRTEMAAVTTRTKNGNYRVTKGHLSAFRDVGSHDQRGIPMLKAICILPLLLLTPLLPVSTARGDSDTGRHATTTYRTPVRCARSRSPRRRSCARCSRTTACARSTLPGRCSPRPPPSQTFSPAAAHSATSG